MSDLFGAVEGFSKFLNDVEATTSIKVSEGEPTEPADAAPVEVLEDNAVNDEKLGQDIQDTAEDIEADSEAVEGLVTRYTGLLEFGAHIKKFGLSKDVYAFMDNTTKYTSMATANGFAVPTVEAFTNTASNKKIIMEANQGLGRKMLDGIVAFLKGIWKKLKDFGSFLMTYLEKAWNGISSLGKTIAAIPSNVKQGIKVRIAKRQLKKAGIDTNKLKALDDIIEAINKVSAESDDPAATSAELVRLLYVIDVTASAENAEMSRPNEDEMDIPADEVEQLLENAEKALAKRNIVVRALDKLNAEVTNIINKLKSNNNEADAEKLSSFKRLGNAISKVTTSIGGFFTRAVNFARGIGGKFMAAVQKNKTAEPAAA